MSREPRSAPPESRRRRLSAAQRRGELVAAAQQLFSRRAPDGVTIDEIAAEAGASRPLVYRFFSSKRELYEAALTQAADELITRFDTPHEGPLAERLHRIVLAYLVFVERHAAGYLALLRGASAVEASHATAVIDRVRRHAVEQMCLHLEIEEPGPWLELTVRTAIALIEATAQIWLADTHVPAPELADWLVDQISTMFTATATRDPQTADVLRHATPHPRPTRT
ncbi:TetR/AcrR family transcriptional regulator [Embleya sp. AB8]|uniref:TetR/AcrR family transcriptional regulator n=1 Tax=Embleya sp. AB8 TaxID=3156304 RepID=UPI003C7485FA